MSPLFGDNMHHDPNATEIVEDCPWSRLCGIFLIGNPLLLIVVFRSLLNFLSIGGFSMKEGIFNNGVPIFLRSLFIAI